MDPYAVLGVPRDASPDQLTAAYRRLAKRWHPDRARGAEAQRRMAEINAAYEQVREQVAPRRRRASRRPPPPRPRRPEPGAGLTEEVRRTLGRELLAALRPGERVILVTPTATWASPHTVLAVTDRRLLWRLADAIGDPIRSLRLSDVERIDHRLAWPLRRRAVVRVRATDRRRFSFAELRPDTARVIVRHVSLARSEDARPRRTPSPARDAEGR